MKVCLICFQESRFDFTESTQVPEFCLLPLMISKTAKCMSGRIAILIKERFYYKELQI